MRHHGGSCVTDVSPRISRFLSASLLQLPWLNGLRSSASGKLALFLSLYEEEAVQPVQPFKLQTMRGAASDPVDFLGRPKPSTRPLAEDGMSGVRNAGRAPSHGNVQREARRNSGPLVAPPRGGERNAIGRSQPPPKYGGKQPLRRAS